MHKRLKPFLTVLFLLAFFLVSYGQQRPRVGLVLSGGGAAGLAHIGVLKVIEEAGIPIDFVGGTSMGSIVGAMYALGYNSAEMESILKKQDWEKLLSDQIPREDLTFEVKEDLEKYFFTFPLTRTGIQLPSGLVVGQNIINYLAGLSWTAYDKTNFSDFPIPFVCIGADIVSGKEVVLNSGVLHDALRASMAIPTAFTAVEIDGKLLIDGGYLNNFPADQVKLLGADIIIGVDVQRDLRTKTELTSMIAILKQASALVREDANERNRELCDILIRPKIPGASTLSFGMVDDIVKNGEFTAREMWEPLLALGENLRRTYGEEACQTPKVQRIDSLYVRELRFTGLDKVSQEYLWSKIDLPFPAWLKPADVSRGMERAYGTNLFTRISYVLEPAPDGARLIVRAEEKKDENANVGLHFDNLFNVSLMLNTRFRNLWKKGDLLSLDFTLGENPHVGGSYFFLTHKRQSYGLKTEYNRLQAYDYINGNKVGSYIYHNFFLDFILKTTYNDVYSVATGLQGEFATVAPSISFFDISAFNSRMLNYYVSFKKDNYNRVPYPTRGEKVEIGLKFIANFTAEGPFPGLVFNYRHQSALPISPRLTFQPGFSAGFAFSDSVPFPYRSYVGGLGYYHQAVFPFVGMNYMERAANHAVIVRGDVQFNVKGNHYVLWRNNIAQSFDTLTEIFDLPSLIVGTGLTYGFATPVGPLEATLMISNNTWKPLLFVNIGYWIR